MTTKPSTRATGATDFRAFIAHLCELWESELSEDVDFREGLDEHTAVAIHTLAHHAAKLGRWASRLGWRGCGPGADAN